MLRKLEQNSTSERLIDAALKLIDASNGIQQVNLREVARLARCAHTNVYNYFQNFDDLLWEVFARLLELWERYVQEHCQADLPPDRILIDFIAAQIQFALDHPGWYRCIWLEPLFRNSPSHILDKFLLLRDQFIQVLMYSSGNRMKAEQIELIENVMHGYLHGEICHLISGRMLVPDTQAYKTMILTNAQAVFGALLRD